MPSRSSHPTTRRAGALSLVVGALFLLAAGLAPAAEATTGTATLHVPHIGATNPGFSEPGDCPVSPVPGATWGWHFVLPGDETTFVSLTVTFLHEGVVTQFVSTPTGKHAYVYTSGPDTLLSATAVVDGPETVFVLSHVCSGSSGTTTTTEGTTSTTEGTTSTTEGTTSTTQGTTSTTEGTTSTTEGTTSTTEGTTSTTEGTTSTTQGTSSTTTGSVLGSSTIRMASTTMAPTTAEVLGVTQTQPRSTLPVTGSNTAPLALLGGLLVIGGLVLFERSRRLG